jgi:hypothetical protein
VLQRVLKATVDSNLVDRLESHNNDLLAALKVEPALLRMNCSLAVVAAPMRLAEGIDAVQWQIEAHNSASMTELSSADESSG